MTRGGSFWSFEGVRVLSNAQKRSRYNQKS
nr:MAG TPA: hypothetical protein [Caudoviricetes sp.]